MLPCKRPARLLVGCLAALAPMVAFRSLADDSTGTPTAIPISIALDWSKTTGQTNPTSYGVNAFTGFDPVNSANPKYQGNLAYMGVGLVRFHSWSMINDSKVDACGWLDVANRKWDAAKIQAALQGFKGSKAAVLINIPGFPSWFKTTDDKLDPTEIKPFADFCADLVRIVNVQGKFNVRYWEITNERDDPYWNHPLQNNGTPQVGALADIFNACALAMKAVDPGIKTGGPAAARPDYVPQLGEFVKDVLPNLDFVSIHAYASGSADDSDLTVFEKAKGFGDRVHDIRQMLDQVSPGRRLPLLLDEYNISWTWQTQDERMKNYKGAVFDALALASMAQAGVDSTCAWNERDGVYGKMDNDYNLRPSANVFHLLNTYGVGNLVSSTLSDADRVTALAVQNPQNQTRFLMLINESQTDRMATIDLGGWSGQADRYVLNKDGFQTDKVDLGSLGGGYLLPGQSLCFLVTDPKASTK